jgi:hypothetical protein
MRVNHEYDRGGALAYLASYDVHQATVFGHCAVRALRGQDRNPRRTYGANHLAVEGPVGPGATGTLSCRAASF